jgi:hypothetical protein
VKKQEHVAQHAANPLKALSHFLFIAGLLDGVNDACDGSHDSAIHCPRMATPLVFIDAEGFVTPLREQGADCRHLAHGAYGTWLR